MQLYCLSHQTFQTVELVLGVLSLVAAVGGSICMEVGGGDI